MDSSLRKNVVLFMESLVESAMSLGGEEIARRCSMMTGEYEKELDSLARFLGMDKTVLMTNLMEKTLVLNNTKLREIENPADITQTDWFRALRDLSFIVTMRGYPICEQEKENLQVIDELLDSDGTKKSALYIGSGTDLTPLFLKNVERIIYLDPLYEDEKTRVALTGFNNIIGSSIGKDGRKVLTNRTKNSGRFFSRDCRKFLESCVENNELNLVYAEADDCMYELNSKYQRWWNFVIPKLCIGGIVYGATSAEEETLQRYGLKQDKQFFIKG